MRAFGRPQAISGAGFYCGDLGRVPGLIHVFLPDGGAGVIAGLDLSKNRATIIGASHGRGLPRSFGASRSSCCSYLSAA
jgi:hypothetical protein